MIGKIWSIAHESGIDWNSEKFARNFETILCYDISRFSRRAAGGDLYFHRPRSQVLQLWRDTGFLDRLGTDHVYATKREAIADI